MKVGIFVHSKTGTTLKFGKMMAEELRKKGHSVEIVELRIDPPEWQGSTRAAPDFKILNMPDGSRYEALLVGGPVWGFSASPIILKCIKGMNGMKGKKVLPFITQGFPFAGMGGKRALSQMSREAEAKGGRALPGKSAQKLFRNIDEMMKKRAAEVPGLFK